MVKLLIVALLVAVCAANECKKISKTVDTDPAICNKCVTVTSYGRACGFCVGGSKAGCMPNSMLSSPCKEAGGEFVTAKDKCSELPITSKDSVLKGVAALKSSGVSGIATGGYSLALRGLSAAKQAFDNNGGNEMAAKAQEMTKEAALSALKKFKVQINEWFESDDAQAWISKNREVICKHAKTAEAATEEGKAGVLCTQLAKDATDLSPAKKAIASMFTGGTAVLKLAAQPEVCKQFMAYAEPHLKSTLEKCPKSRPTSIRGYLPSWMGGK